LYVWTTGGETELGRGTAARSQRAFPTESRSSADDHGHGRSQCFGHRADHRRSETRTRQAGGPAEPVGEATRHGARIDGVCGRIFDRANSDSSLTAEQQDLLARCNGLLIGNTAANQVEALDQLAPDDFAVARTQTLLFANTQYASVMDRLMALRGGAKDSALPA